MSKPRNIGDQIKQLRSKKMTYSQIANKLLCSKATVSYHLGSGQKLKTKKRSSKQHPYKKKTFKFCSKYTIKNQIVVISTARKRIQCKIDKFHMNELNSFTIEDLIQKFGENPKCYLTGDPINIWEPSSYHFDHILPRSRGGDNSIDNLGICTKAANMAKSDLTLEEFRELCQKVVDNN